MAEDRKKNAKQAMTPRKDENVTTVQLTPGTKDIASFFSQQMQNIGSQLCRSVNKAKKQKENPTVNQAENPKKPVSKPEKSPVKPNKPAVKPDKPETKTQKDSVFKKPLSKPTIEPRTESAIKKPPNKPENKFCINKHINILKYSFKKGIFTQNQPSTIQEDQQKSKSQQPAEKNNEPIITPPNSNSHCATATSSKVANAKTKPGLIPETVKSTPATVESSLESISSDGTVGSPEDCSPAPRASCANSGTESEDELDVCGVFNNENIQIREITIAAIENPTTCPDAQTFNDEDAQYVLAALMTPPSVHDNIEVIEDLSSDDEDADVHETEDGSGVGDKSPGNSKSNSAEETATIVNKTSQREEIIPGKKGGKRSAEVLGENNDPDSGPQPQKRPCSVSPSSSVDTELLDENDIADLLLQSDSSISLPVPVTESVNDTHNANQDAEMRSTCDDNDDKEKNSDESSTPSTDTVANHSNRINKEVSSVSTTAITATTNATSSNLAIQTGSYSPISDCPQSIDEREEQNNDGLSTLSSSDKNGNEDQVSPTENEIISVNYTPIATEVLPLAAEKDKDNEIGVSSEPANSYVVMSEVPETPPSSNENVRDVVSSEPTVMAEIENSVIPSPTPTIEVSETENLPMNPDNNVQTVEEATNSIATAIDKSTCEEVSSHPSTNLVGRDESVTDNLSAENNSSEVDNSDNNENNEINDSGSSNDIVAESLRLLGLSDLIGSDQSETVESTNNNNENMENENAEYNESSFLQEERNSLQETGMEIGLELLREIQNEALMDANAPNASTISNPPQEITETTRAVPVTPTPIPVLDSTSVPTNATHTTEDIPENSSFNLTDLSTAGNPANNNSVTLNEAVESRDTNESQATISSCGDSVITANVLNSSETESQAADTEVLSTVEDDANSLEQQVQTPLIRVRNDIFDVDEGDNISDDSMNFHTANDSGESFNVSDLTTFGVSDGRSPGQQVETSLSNQSVSGTSTNLVEDNNTNATTDYSSLPSTSSSSVPPLSPSLANQSAQLNICKFLEAMSAESNKHLNFFRSDYSGSANETKKHGIDSLRRTVLHFASWLDSITSKIREQCPELEIDPVPLINMDIDASIDELVEYIEFVADCVAFLQWKGVPETARHSVQMFVMRTLRILRYFVFVKSSSIAEAEMKFRSIHTIITGSTHEAIVGLGGEQSKIRFLLKMLDAIRVSSYSENFKKYAVLDFTAIPPEECRKRLTRFKNQFSCFRPTNPSSSTPDQNQQVASNPLYSLLQQQGQNQFQQGQPANCQAQQTYTISHQPSAAATPQYQHSAQQQQIQYSAQQQQQIQHPATLQRLLTSQTIANSQRQQQYAQNAYQNQNNQQTQATFNQAHTYHHPNQQQARLLQQNVLQHQKQHQQYLQRLQNTQQTNVQPLPPTYIAACSQRTQSAQSPTTAHPQYQQQQTSNRLPQQQQHYATQVAIANGSVVSAPPYTQNSVAPQTLYAVTMQQSNIPQQRSSAGTSINRSHPVALQQHLAGQPVHAGNGQYLSASSGSTTPYQQSQIANSGGSYQNAISHSSVAGSVGSVPDQSQYRQMQTNQPDLQQAGTQLYVRTTQQVIANNVVSSYNQAAAASTANYSNLGGASQPVNSSSPVIAPTVSSTNSQQLYQQSNARSTAVSTIANAHQPQTQISVPAPPDSEVVFLGESPRSNSASPSNTANIRRPPTGSGSSSPIASSSTTKNGMTFYAGAPSPAPTQDAIIAANSLIQDALNTHGQPNTSQQKKKGPGRRRSSKSSALPRGSTMPPQGTNTTYQQFRLENGVTVSFPTNLSSAQTVPQQTSINPQTQTPQVAQRVAQPQQITYSNAHQNTRRSSMEQTNNSPSSTGATYLTTSAGAASAQQSVSPNTYQRQPLNRGNSTTVALQQAHATASSSSVASNITPSSTSAEAAQPRSTQQQQTYNATPSSSTLSMPSLDTLLNEAIVNGQEPGNTVYFSTENGDPYALNPAVASTLHGFFSGNPPNNNR